MRPSFSCKTLKPPTMRTPRLTWVSEGKPRRRLLIFSKEHLFAAALDCHGLLLFIKSFIRIPTIHLHRRFAPGSIQQNHRRAGGLLTHHRDDRLQVGHAPDQRAVPDPFSWQLTVVIWNQTPAVCRPGSRFLGMCRWYVSNLHQFRKPRRNARSLAVFLQVEANLFYRSDLISASNNSLIRRFAKSPTVQPIIKR